jgi:Kef-type K+ transport system membrane component KefB
VLFPVDIKESERVKLTEIVQLFLALGLIIVFAKTFGYISTRFHQPAVLGELVAGILIGPSVIDLLHTVSIFPDGASVEHTIIEIAEIGVLLLMFSAGLEIDLEGMAKVGSSAISAGILGVVVPVLLTLLISVLFGYPGEISLFIGLMLAATSVSISAQVMLELGVLRTREGLALLGAAVVDDILVVLLISLFIAINPNGIVTSGENRSIVEVIVRLVGFLVISTGLGWLILPRIAERLERTSISEAVLMTAMVAALLFGFAAEFFGGVAAITGAFIAGICLGRSDRRIVEEIDEGLHRINYGFFVPIFFVSIGLQANLRLLDSNILPFAVILTLGAIISKVLGAGSGALLTRFPRRSALRLGIGMISRGEVGLIVAALGVSSGIIDETIFAAIVLVVIVTTIMTPPLVRWSFAEPTPASVPPESTESTEEVPEGAV